MTQLLRFALFALGLSYALTQSALLSGLRCALIHRLPPLLVAGMYCKACVGFWAGAVLAACGAYPQALLWNAGELEPFMRVLEAGCVTMTLGALWATWQGGNPAWDAEVAAHLEGDATHAPQTQEGENG